MDMFRHRSAPLLQYPCFHTTVVITANQNHFKITAVLLDSGASTNVIGRKLARRFGLNYYPFVASMEFRTANGRVANNEEVDLMVSMAGVWQKLSFVVSDADDMTMILGTPAFVKYKVGMKWGAGGVGGIPRQTLVTIEVDPAVQPNVEEREIVVEADQRYGPSMVIELRDNGVRNEALRLGETLEQHQERQGAEAAAVSRALQEVDVSRVIGDALAVVRR